MFQDYPITIGRGDKANPETVSRSAPSVIKIFRADIIIFGGIYYV